MSFSVRFKKETLKPANSCWCCNLSYKQSSESACVFSLFGNQNKDNKTPVMWNAAGFSIRELAHVTSRSAKIDGDNRMITEIESLDR